MGDLKEHLLELPEDMRTINWNLKVDYLYAQQLQSWEMARNHYSQFETVEKRILQFENFNIEVQYNPARARSTCADLSKQVIEKRPCFLCSSNLPNEQKGFAILDKYILLINPFPIFKKHLTISDFTHTPQNIENKITDMLTIAKELSGFTIFYNGPRCGASAPDHFHFQAAQKGVMPIDNEINTLILKQGIPTLNENDIKITQNNNYLRTTLILESSCRETIDYFFSKAIQQLPFDAESNEPMLNIISNYQNGNYRLILFPRSTQRPGCYFKKDPDKILVSPASVELGGIVITPRKEDFHKLTKEKMKEIFEEVSDQINFHF